MKVGYAVTAGAFWLTALFTAGQAAYFHQQAELIEAARSQLRGGGSVAVGTLLKNIDDLQRGYPHVDLAAFLQRASPVISSASPVISTVPSILPSEYPLARVPVPSPPATFSTPYEEPFTAYAPGAPPTSTPYEEPFTAYAPATTPSAGLSAQQPPSAFAALDQSLEEIADNSRTSSQLYGLAAAALGSLATYMTSRSFRRQPRMNTSSAVP